MGRKTFIQDDQSTENYDIVENRYKALAFNIITDQIKNINDFFCPI